MKVETFQLIGLCKPGSFTLQRIDDDSNMFWATSETISKERFEALFKYSKGNWSDKKLAKCEYDSLSEDGTPVNCKVLEVFEA